MSQFLHSNDDYSLEYSSGIDFDDAVRLPGGGSICDIFKTRWQRRDVFVKRLKEEYRSKPLYLDALDKEYEIGVSLKHPSLPDYREFHHDYIVMDYIDGMTLADMMRRQDPWLSDEQHIRRMLSQLIDAVDYLHRHNVVHCDIKQDNIMITANGHNIILIDFDKCYTDSLNDTSGDPAKYGVSADETGNVAIDFHGMAKVVERLKAGVPGFRLRCYKEFIKRCYASDVTCGELTALLSKNRPFSVKAVLAATGVMAAAILIGIGVYISDYKGNERKDATAPELSAGNVTDTIETTPGIPTSPQLAQPPRPTANQEVNAFKTPVEKPANAVADAPDAIAVLDKTVSPYFNSLVARLDNLDRMRNDTTLSRRQLVDRFREYRHSEEKTVNAVLDIVYDLYPETTSQQRADLISDTPSYLEFIRRAKVVKDNVWTEINRRPKNDR